MLKRTTVLTALCGLTLSSLAAAGQPLAVKPWTYDPDNLGIVEASWETGIGLPDAGKSDHALVLEKNGDTAENAAAGAYIPFEGTLTELGFDVRNDSHCGAGAPRFNVYTTSGVYYFYGCLYGTHAPAPDSPEEWTRVRFVAADGFPSDGASDIEDFSEIEVTGIEIVFDEGTDVGNGYAILDNIAINGTLIGKPGSAAGKRK